MIGTIDIEIMAANPSMPLYPVRAFVNSPTSIRLRNVPKKVGQWNITTVQLVAAYPDGSIKTANCVLTGGVWVGTIEGCATSGKSENGFTVFASGIDENGNPVTNYVLGKGLIEILQADGTITPDAPSYYVHLYDAQPTTPKEGDMYPTSDGYVIWQDGEAHGLGLNEEAIVGIIQETVPSLIPSNVSSFNNDAGYITASAIPPIPSKTSDLTNDSGFITAQAIPSNVSSFNNDAGYVTSSEVSTIVTERTEPEYGDWTVTPEVQGYWEISYDGNDTWSMSIAPDETEPPIAFVSAEGGEDATNLVFDGSVTGAPDYVATRTVTPSRNVLNLAMYQDLTSFATQDYVQSAIPSNVSSFNNDAGYITSSQVEPFGLMYPKWAMKAWYTAEIMNQTPGARYPNQLMVLGLQSGVPLVQITTYLPWTLIYWDGTQFDPSIEIANLQYLETLSIKIGNRVQTVYVGGWVWLDSTKTYFIKAEQDSDGLFQPTQFGVRSNRTITWHDITLSADEKSIESVEGTTGLTECIRTGISEKSYRYLAYTDQIPTVPSNVSSFNNDAGYVTSSEVSTIVTPIASNVETIQGMIPSSASSSNKLVAANSLNFDLIMAPQDTQNPTLPTSAFPIYFNWSGGLTFSDMTGLVIRAGYDYPNTFVLSYGDEFNIAYFATDTGVFINGAYNSAVTFNGQSSATLIFPYVLQDRTINTISVTADNPSTYVTLPDSITDHARDFMVRIVASAGTYGTTPTLNVGGGITLMNANGQMPTIATDTNTTKTTLVHFSEIAANTFIINSESLQVIT